MIISLGMVIFLLISKIMLLIEINAFKIECRKLRHPIHSTDGIDLPYYFL